MSWRRRIGLIGAILTDLDGKIAIVKYTTDNPGPSTVIICGSLFHSLTDTLTKEGLLVEYDNFYGWHKLRGYDIYIFVIDSHYTLKNRGG